jgi:hypothetical protein
MLCETRTTHAYAKIIGQAMSVKFGCSWSRAIQYATTAKAVQTKVPKAALSVTPSQNETSTELAGARRGIKEKNVQCSTDHAIRAAEATSLTQPTVSGQMPVTATHAEIIHITTRNMEMNACATSFGAAMRVKSTLRRAIRFVEIMDVEDQAHVIAYRAWSTPISKVIRASAMINGKAKTVRFIMVIATPTV